VNTARRRRAQPWFVDAKKVRYGAMGAGSSATEREDSTASGDGDSSVTAVGEDVIVRAASIEIARGTILAGRYQVEAVIGRGGSGIVLRAFDRIAQVPVAVKILKPDLAGDPRWVERFSRELRLGRQIQHPNVCRIFDIGQADGHWFITMELAGNGTLRDDLGDASPARSAAAKLADVRAVVGGLAAIHEAGIVHRDLKPDNFLRMEDGRLVLSDFGLATNPADAPTVSIMVGTPHYMAPEVVMGEAASPESDVWSAGVVLHEILVGKRPARTSPTRAQPAALPSGASRHERALLAIAETCLAEELAERPRDGAALRELVERAAAGEGGHVRGQEMRRRVWALVAVATVALLATFSRRLWQPAGATLAARPGTTAPIMTEGVARDLGPAAKRLAEIDGHVHCFSVLRGGETARVVWGSPPRAEDVDLTTGARRPTPLPAETFAVGCPELSPTGDHLLFTRQPTSSPSQIVLANADGSDPTVVSNGSEPLWLPNGQEFAFYLDYAHAGVYSLATMSYTILDDDRGKAARFVFKKAVSPRGDLLALLYNPDDLSNRALEVHALPDLRLVASWTVPHSIHGLSFDDRGLLLSDFAGDRSLERLDWKTGRAERVARLGSDEIRSITPGAGASRVLLSSANDRDAWEFAPGRSPRRLTYDGRVYWASGSPSGDILLGKLLDDGRYVVSLEDGSGTVKVVTPGPSDASPSFSPDGTTWTYAAYDRKAIVRCEGEHCSDIVHDKQLLVWPVLSPDNARIAFVTGNGIFHLRVASSDGRDLRDLGPTAGECPPVWTSSTSIWAFSGGGAARDWRELDARDGKPTGRSKPASGFNADTGTCGDTEAPGIPLFQRVRVVAHETWGISSTRAADWGLD
jgi:hypothetical protein